MWLGGGQALRYMSALAKRRLRDGSSVRSRSSASRRHTRRHQHESLGTIALHYSAAEIQWRWRRHAARRTSVERARPRAPPSARAASSELALALGTKFLGAKRATRGAAARGRLTYRGWCASRIQAWWRMRPLRAAWLSRRWVVFAVAARSLQRCWLERLLRRARAAHGAVPDDPRQLAAGRLQRAWRGVASRRLMRLFVGLIKFREQGNPAALLRSINPREAALLDAAAGGHVRFRLGGPHWPPRIYYKIYTASVTDICAFAPRDYARAKQLPARSAHLNPQPGERRGAEPLAGWYSRVEHNGWRPVQPSLLEEVDPLTASSAAKPVPFAPVRAQRREDVLQRRRRQKLGWLRKMYAQRGAEGAPDDAPPPAGGAEGGGGDGQGVDELLRWTEELDFDAYYTGWLTLATTGRTKPAAPLAYLDDLDALEEDGGTYGLGGELGAGGAYYGSPAFADASQLPLPPLGETRREDEDDALSALASAFPSSWLQNYQSLEM